MLWQMQGHGIPSDMTKPLKFLLLVVSNKGACLKIKNNITNSYNEARPTMQKPDHYA